MIQLYFGPTPNARKISIMLEELGLDYHVHEIDILAGDQFKPEFLAINPNNKMPAIVDPEGPDGRPIAVWETGAILIYLAEKHGRFMPADPRARMEPGEPLLQCVQLTAAAGDRALAAGVERHRAAIEILMRA